MHVLILGGTGPSGLLVIEQFFKVYPNGSATLYARNPSKFPAHISSNPGVTIVMGELDDKAALESAFLGKPVDAVLSALGPIIGQKTDFSPVYRLLISVMAAHNCKRLVALSTAFATDPRDKFHLLSSLLVWVVYLFVHSAYKTIVEYTHLIETECPKNGIEYTVVRVPNLNMNKSHRPVAGYIGDGKTGVFLSRYAMAEFYVSAIESKEWVDKSPALSSVSV